MRICNIRDVRYLDRTKCHAGRLYALIIIDRVPQDFGTAEEEEKKQKTKREREKKRAVGYSALMNWPVLQC